MNELVELWLHFKEVVRPPSMSTWRVLAILLTLPIWKHFLMVVLVRPAGFEPAAYSSGGCRSIHLSYGRTLEESTRTVRCAPTGSLAPQRRSTSLNRRWDVFK